MKDAPRTIEVIERVNSVLAKKGWTREQFRVLINEHLSEGRKLPNTAGSVQMLTRWLNPNLKGWPEPRAEIILAMINFLDKNENYR